MVASPSTRARISAESRDFPTPGGPKMVNRWHSCSRAAREQECHLFTIFGPPGVGKSRLSAEILARVEGEATILRGRCLPYGKGITFWPLVEIIRASGGL